MITSTSPSLNRPVVKPPLQIPFHLPSAIFGALCMLLWLGTAWGVVEYSRSDSGTKTLVRAMESDDSRLVTITFADGSQIMRIPPQSAVPLLPPIAKKK